MKVLVTGASGFIGSHLCPHLLNKKLEVVGTWHKKKPDIPGVKTINVNLENLSEVIRLIRSTKPDYIFHLAGQTLVIPSWQNPHETFQSNILSTLNLLEAMKQTGLKVRLLIFGSASEYQSSEKKITEDSPLLPNSPYALSKMVQDFLGLLYFKSYNLDIVRIRPFFIIGPGKVADVCSDFSRRIVDIEKSKERELRVGNLKAIREYIDIDDAVRAIWLIAQKGKKGEVYNLCSGIPISVEKILHKLVSLSSINVKTVLDKKLFRPIDEPMKVGDNQKLRKMGWKPTVYLDKSLERILNYWREKEDRI